MRYSLIIAMLLLASCSISAESSSGSIVEQPDDSVIYLWPDGNMPSLPEHRTLNGNPYIEVFDVPEGTPVKGAVMVCPGGAFSYLSPAEGRPVAEELAVDGYVSFVVYYRVRPYSMDESTLDLARAIRIARSRADRYGFNPDDIAAVGFSAGGILVGNESLYFDGNVNGTTVVTTRERAEEAIDPSYIPDEIDAISADLVAIGMCYSFYGILSYASSDVQSFIDGEIPPTYFCYGSDEVFRSQIEMCMKAVAESGTPVDTNMIDGYQHGFGARGGWIPDFCDFLEIYMD